MRDGSIGVTVDTPTPPAAEQGVSRRTWHIVVPALVGAVSIPLALFAGSPALTIAVITLVSAVLMTVLARRTASSTAPMRESASTAERVR